MIFTPKSQFYKPCFTAKSHFLTNIIISISSREHMCQKHKTPKDMLIDSFYPDLHPVPGRISHGNRYAQFIPNGEIVNIHIGIGIHNFRHADMVFFAQLVKRISFLYNMDDSPALLHHIHITLILQLLPPEKL